MVCESKSTALTDLKRQGILGEYNDILDMPAFEAYNKELTRFAEIKYGIVTDGEMLFSVNETETTFPRTSSYLRDDVQVTRYAQPNDPLFEAVDTAKIQADIQEELGEYDITEEPDSTFPEDPTLDPMFMRGNVKNSLNDEFSKKFKTAMIDFMKGLNIDVKENADEIFEREKRRRPNSNMANAMAAFDLLQKFLALRSDITDKALAMQTANVIQSFLGRKSKLGGQLWRGINTWSKYNEVYNKYASRFDAERKNNPEIDSMYVSYGGRIVEVGYEKQDSVGRFNSWAHKQTINEFLAEMLRLGADIGYTGQKRTNPDISKEYFESQGYRDKYEQNWFKRMFNQFMNWLNETLGKIKAFETLHEGLLKDVAMDIVDDVYKKDYTKFIRGIIEETPGNFVNSKGQPLEVKDYQATLDKDPFAKMLIETMITNSKMGYRLSGSQVLRKYGRLVRPLDEDLHDIDGVITLEQFNKEKNHVEFREYLQTRGLELMKDRYNKKNQAAFMKEIIPFLEKQEWYKQVKKLPGWGLDVAFIGKDHKNAESVTITGHVEDSTQTELVTADNLKGRPKSDIGKIMPKRYVLDFFLRTDQGNYPEVFDNYWKDWKQIFEAKINMGRGKDIADLIYFVPFQQDAYKFTNKGFYYFSFADDTISNTPKYKETEAQKDSQEIKPEEVIVEVPLDVNAVQKARAQELAEVVGERLAAGLNVNFSNISEDQARTLLSARKKQYNGEAAFFYGGTVYIVGDNMNLDTVLHEFSHPLLRAIRMENTKLFDNLYSLLETTSEGRFLKQHVARNYPELNENDPLFKEEVLAYALQLKASNKVTKEIETEGFESFIGKLLYAIRQILKKIFGNKTKA